MVGKLEKRVAKRYRKSNKTATILVNPKHFAGGTINMNRHLFQSIHESKDTTQYVKTVEALERYAFKTYSVDLSSLFRRKHPSKPEVEVPKKPTKNEVDRNPALQDIY